MVLLNKHALWVDVQLQTALETPSSTALSQWAETAYAMACVALNRGSESSAELSILLVDEPQGRELNVHYRKKDYATNVLSFPAETMLPNGVCLLGDIVICAPVVQREALKQTKPEAAHWAHMMVHGVLHLLGYDHIDEDDAQAMESLEIKIMEQLDFLTPYA